MYYIPCYYPCLIKYHSYYRRYSKGYLEEHLSTIKECETCQMKALENCFCENSGIEFGIEYHIEFGSTNVKPREPGFFWKE